MAVAAATVAAAAVAVAAAAVAAAAASGVDGEVPASAARRRLTVGRKAWLGFRLC